MYYFGIVIKINSNFPSVKALNNEKNIGKIEWTFQDSIILQNLDQKSSTYYNIYRTFALI